MAIVADPKDILGVARELWQQRDGLQRDQVDGRFFWKFCRPELAERVEVLLVDFERAEKAGTESVSIAEEVFRQVNMMKVENPSLWTALHEPQSLTMRGAYFYHGDRSGPEGLAGRYIRAGITSADWSGDRVEREIRAYAERNDLNSKAAESARSFAGFSVRFWLVEAGAPLADVSPGTFASRFRLLLTSPVVAVDVTFPLPPEPVIALTYDTLVINEKQWHRLLAPLGNGQKVDVAIRTWATALLVATGRRLHLAMGDVDEALGTESPVERVYRRNLAELFKRVPEAMTFLQSPRRSDL